MEQNSLTTKYDSQEIKAISKKIDKLTNHEYTKITDSIKIENQNKTITNAMFDKFLKIQSSEYFFV